MNLVQCASQMHRGDPLLGGSGSPLLGGFGLSDWWLLRATSHFVNKSIHNTYRIQIIFHNAIRSWAEQSV